MINAVAVYGISFYQQHLSPYKGFQCAYRVHTGRCSCSECAKRIVTKRGVGILLKAMPRQFARCKLAYASLHAEQLSPTGNQRPRRRSRNQNNKADWCPLDACGACDLPFDAQGLACDVGPCDCSL